MMAKRGLELFLLRFHEQVLKIQKKNQNVGLDWIRLAWPSLLALSLKELLGFRNKIF